MKRFLFFLGLTLSFVIIGEGPLFSEETAEETFIRAETLYRNQDFQGAMGLYEELLKDGLRTSALYYNLGNAYYKADDVGKAVLNYERALRLSPEDQELRHNLAFVREFLQDQVTQSEPSRWMKRLARLPRFFSTDAMTLILSFCYQPTSLYLHVYWE